ncbi:MAG: gluconokinase [Herminiimonas sp.]|nr:gluconokinase [Herminiimonas sp.]
MGVSGCGKSVIGAALAARLGWRFLEGDTLHGAASVAKMAAGMPLSDDDRRGWLERLRDRITEARGTATPLVLSCSALKRRYRDLLREGDPGLALLYLDGNPALIAARMQQRTDRTDHFMPVSLLASQLRDLEPPGPDERFLRLDPADSPAALVEQVRQIFGMVACSDPVNKTP